MIDKENPIDLINPNEYEGINDGYGVVGYSFMCVKCKTENRFVDEESEIQECHNCNHENIMKPIKYN